MAKPGAERRPEGSIRLRGGSYQVRVYAGVDPVTNKPNYLTGSSRDEDEAKRILRKLLNEVDEQRHARTKATFGRAVDIWLGVHEAEENTRKGYETHARLYIKPALGDVPIGKINPQLLEELYAQLRRCRIRCNGKVAIDHREKGEHECRAVRHRRPPGRRPANWETEHDCKSAGCVVEECPPHECKPLSASTVRQIHIAISGALSAAVRWDWIKSNPATVAKKPRQRPPEPDPPSSEDAARIVAGAWDEDDDWGTFVWLVFMTGVRRAEALALRWSRLDIDNGVLDVRRNYVWVNGRGVEKDTKTHQRRRIALDRETVELLRQQRVRHDQVADSLGIVLTNEAFLFSHAPERDRPYNPDTVTHRYTRMCAGLGIASHLHALRHYSATELLTAGIDLRTVAGRLGHGGGGATTLRVYAAWVGSADRSAAEILGSKLQRPPR